MQLFYAAEFTAPEYILSEEESRHAVKVLRLVEGDTLHITDGRGSLYRCEVASAHQKHCLVRVVEHFAEFEKLPYNLTMAVAPTKNIDRFEWFVEKATEIGFDELTPLCCRYSERKVIKPERIEKILVSAAKQSLKAYVPRLNPMMTAKEFISQNCPFELGGRAQRAEGGCNSQLSTLNSQLFIAHCYDQPKQHLFNACQPGGDVIVMVGPEGDFSEEEVELALRNSFQAITLGESRLRTETAGVVACHLVTVANLK